MAESGLHSISDLLRWNPLTHHNEWNIDVLRDSPMLRPLLQLTPPQFPTSPLISGQCWASHTHGYPYSEGFIWEFIGMTDNDIANIRVWKTSAPISIGATARLLTPSCAGGTNIHILLVDLLHGPMQKIILSGDMADRIGVKRSVLSSRPHRHPVIGTCTPLNHPLLCSIIGGNKQELCASTMYTDGSCTQHTSLIQNPLGKRSSITSGAIALPINDTDVLKVYFDLVTKKNL